jgi:hypothetical protein
MGFGEQWRLLSRINLSWTETSLGLFSEGLAPLLTGPPIIRAFLWASSACLFLNDVSANTECQRSARTHPLPFIEPLLSPLFLMDISNQFRQLAKAFTKVGLGEASIVRTTAVSSSLGVLCADEFNCFRRHLIRGCSAND